MSPLIGFTHLKDKILDGTKRQTIRRARKHPIQVGDKLILYWHLRQKDCEKLGEATCTQIIHTPWRHLKMMLLQTDLCQRDGFTTGQEAVQWFENTHKPQPDDIFTIIRWGELSNQTEKPV